MKTLTYSEVSSSASGHNEDNDCAIRAFAIASGIDYDSVHAFMKANGRVAKRGTKWPQVNAFVQHLKDNGYEVEYVDPVSKYFLRGVEVTRRWSMKTIGKHYPTGNYVWYVRGHVAAVVNGKVEDWTKGTRHIVTRGWKITKK